MIDYSRAALTRHSVDMRQFVDYRSATLQDGQRIIEVSNSSGLALTLLPDRGLDIWAASYKGIPLTWLSQGSPHAPDWGKPALALFNGGLLMTCGLQHVGPPETDTQTGVWRDLHGQYMRLKAAEISTSGGWEDDTTYTRKLTGVIAQGALFGTQLRMERTFSTTLGDPAITITDTVHNLADEPAPLMLLHHVNLGYPLVREGTQLHTPNVGVYPRDDNARNSAEDWPHYHAAQPLHAEEVFFHHVHADANGYAQAALLHEDFGLHMSWDARTAPYLTQWKNFRQGMYVCGVEPGNCIPEGQNQAREQGRLVMLEPGEAQTFTLNLRVVEGREAVAASRDAIARLAREGQPVSNCQLADYA